jgi:putative ABC transport system ATP-binding protein
MIELNNITMSYSMAGTVITVLRDLDFSVGPRERVAIVGPSGSGKSTLLLLMTGLEQAQSGSVRINGNALESMDRDQRADLRRKEIGIVFQSFHLIPSLTACENVALPLDIAGVGDSSVRAGEMLNRVGLSERQTHYPAQLSGGEQQRVAIARALVHRPGIIFADEPTGNLDEATGQSIMELLFDLKNESGATLLLVTHDPAVAMRCDRTLRLHEGRLHDTAVPSSEASNP